MEYWIASLKVLWYYHSIYRIRYPPFPEDIAFGKDLKRQGIGCHHPKLFVLQRDEFLRVIITSANLVPTQVISNFKVLLLHYTGNSSIAIVNLQTVKLESYYTCSG